MIELIKDQVHRLKHCHIEFILKHRAAKRVVVASAQQLHASQMRLVVPLNVLHMRRLRVLQNGCAHLIRKEYQIMVCPQSAVTRSKNDIIVGVVGTQILAQQIGQISQIHACCVNGKMRDVFCAHFAFNNLPTLLRRRFHVHLAEIKRMREASASMVRQVDIERVVEEIHQHHRDAVECLSRYSWTSLQHPKRATTLCVEWVGGVEYSCYVLVDGAYTVHCGEIVGERGGVIPVQWNLKRDALRRQVEALRVVLEIEDGVDAVFPFVHWTVGPAIGQQLDVLLMELRLFEPRDVLTAARLDQYG
mmetsp:Transcript_58833/g.93553  ORF Transcript_58833/g.93553 Transcript_58833/m.93553 type:complete len:304 (+) Transcript_58833:534-1445(+)